MSTTTIKQHSLWKRFQRGSTLILLSVIIFLSGIDLALSQDDSVLQDDSTLAQVISEQKESDRNLMSINFTNVTLEKALEILADRINVGFSYNPDLMPNKNVSFEMRNVQAHEIIYQLLEGTNLEPVLPPSRDVIILREKVVRLAPEILQETVTGIVTDTDTGESLPGVNVILVGSEEIAGSTIGTTTNMDGFYEIDVPENFNTLAFTFVGYQRLEVEIDGRTEVNVQLSSDVQLLDDVVVIGYGTTDRRNLTGSVSSVNMADLEEAASFTSIEQGLSGKVAGVNVTQTSGRPGSAVSVRIRGSSSIQGGNEPLYVIDGFPIYSEGVGPGGKLGALSMLNPQDIQSIDFLKDASATAIYGSRASNGVVLITTRSGFDMEDEVTFNMSAGSSQITRTIPMMNALEYAELTNKAFTNDGLEPYYDEAEMARIREIHPGTDWQDEIYRTAPTQNYNLRFSGGEENYTYSVSGSYTDEDGIVKNSDFKRYMGRINLNRDISEKLTMSANFNVSNIQSNFIQEGQGRNDAPSSALIMSPILPIYQDDAETIYTYENTPGRNVPNPVATVNEITDEYSTIRALGSIKGRYNITSNLIANIDFGFDLQEGRHDNYIPSNISQGLDANSGTIRESNTTNWLNENTLEWSAEVGQNHSLDLLGGFTLQKNIFKNSLASAEQFPTDRLKTNDLSMASVYNQPNSNQTEWSMVSYLGRVNYNLMDRFLFTVTGRIDGSSRFGEGNKYGYFPSGAFAWRLSQEDFINDLNIFDELKFRISYGITGNQEIGLYNSLSTLGTSVYTFGDGIVTGISPNKMPNPDLKWERSGQLDIGLDMEFFDNRLRITADYFDKTTSDLLYNVGIPFTSGFNSALQNIAELNNKGFDLDVSGDIYVNNDFSMSAEFNISAYKNKVTDLGGEAFRWVGSDIMHSGPAHRLEVGKPVAYFYGYEWDGVYQNESELHDSSPTNYVGGWKYVDQNNDGTVNADDRTRIGNPHPDFYGGLSTNLSYKGVSLSVSTTFKYGNDILNFNNLSSAMPTGGGNVFKGFTNYWDGENSTDKYARPSTRRSQMFSSRMLEDGSYFKISNLRLGYSFPNIMAKTQSIRRLSVYINMSNYFTFTDYNGYDPEISFRGISNLAIGEDYSQYPRTKSISAGINVTF